MYVASRCSFMVMIIIGMSCCLDISYGQDAAPDANAIYRDWLTGKKQLVDDRRAQEFEALFRPPLLCALPEQEDIIAIYAELETDILTTPVTTDKPGLGPKFKVPAKYHQLIYDKIKDCKVDRRPYFEGLEAGSLKIYTRHGNMTRVCWYSMHTKKGPLLLSIHGIRFIIEDPNEEGDVGIVFTRLIERAHADSKQADATHKKVKESSRPG